MVKPKGQLLTLCFGLVLIIIGMFFIWHETINIEGKAIYWDKTAASPTDVTVGNNTKHADENGAYSLENLPRGRQQIKFSLSDTYFKTREFVPDLFSKTGNVPVSWSLIHLSRLRGIVLDSMKQPVPRAKVLTSIYSKEHFHPNSTTDSNGEFQINNVTIDPKEYDSQTTISVITEGSNYPSVREHLKFSDNDYNTGDKYVEINIPNRITINVSGRIYYMHKGTSGPIDDLPAKDAIVTMGCSSSDPTNDSGYYSVSMVPRGIKDYSVMDSKRLLHNESLMQSQQSILKDIYRDEASIIIRI